MKIENKPRHVITNSRPISMLSHHYNLNPVIGVRRRW